jgi:hypothetical protein
MTATTASSHRQHLLHGRQRLLHGHRQLLHGPQHERRENLDFTRGKISSAPPFLSLTSPQRNSIGGR